MQNNPFRAPGPAPKRRKLSAKTGRAAVATKAYVRKAIETNVQKHFHLRTLTIGDASYDNVSMIDITAIPQGNTDITRIGDSCHLRSVAWGINVTGSATNSSGVRLVIFQWKPLSTPAPEDVVSAAGDALGGGSWSIGHYNHDQRKNFSVLYDEAFGIAALNAGWVSIRHFKGMYNIGLNAKRKLCTADLQFVAGGTTGYNHVWFMAMSNQSDASNAGPVVNLRTKVNFNG